MVCTNGLKTSLAGVASLYGKALTLRIRSESGYNPSTGQVSESTSDESFNGIISDFSLQDIADTTIQRGDKRILAPADGLTQPSTNDLIIDGSTTYNIESLMIHEVAGSAISYEIQARQVK